MSILAEWLYLYLRNQPCKPEIEIPSNYQSGALFLLDSLSDENQKTASKFGDAAYELLKTLIGRSEITPFLGNYYLLHEILLLLEGLPTSQGANVSDFLNNMRITKRYKTWPDEKSDSHRMILYALCNQLDCSYGGLPGWERSILDEMGDTNYLVAGLLLLLRVNIGIGIEHLPNTLDILEMNEASPSSLLYSLTFAVDKRPEYWPEVAIALGMADLGKYGDEISDILNANGQDQLASEFRRWLEDPEMAKIESDIVMILDRDYIDEPFMEAVRVSQIAENAKIAGIVSIGFLADLAKKKIEYLSPGILHAIRISEQQHQKIVRLMDEVLAERES